MKMKTVQWKLAYPSHIHLAAWIMRPLFALQHSILQVYYACNVYTHVVLFPDPHIVYPPEKGLSDFLALLSQHVLKTGKQIRLQNSPEF